MRGQVRVSVTMIMFSMRLRSTQGLHLANILRQPVQPKLLGGVFENIPQFRDVTSADCIRDLSDGIAQAFHARNPVFVLELAESLLKLLPRGVELAGTRVEVLGLELQRGEDAADHGAGLGVYMCRYIFLF